MSIHVYRSSHRRFVDALVCACVVLSGCRSYSPLGGVAPVVESTIRLQLTDSGSVAMRSYLGPSVVYVTGRLTGIDSSGLALAVGETQGASGATTYWKGERAVIPRSYVAVVEQEKLAPVRTALLGGAIAAALAGAFHALSSASGSVTGGPSPGPR